MEAGPIPTTLQGMQQGGHDEFWRGHGGGRINVGWLPLGQHATYLPMSLRECFKIL